MKKNILLKLNMALILLVILCSVKSEPKPIQIKFDYKEMKKKI